jgi:hypothetical protein
MPPLANLHARLVRRASLTCRERVPNRLLAVRRLAAVLCLISLPLCHAQQAPPPLSVQAAKIRAMVKGLGPGEQLSVLMKDGAEYHGSLVASGPESFSLSEADEKRTVEVHYEGVKKVRRGYGGYNSVTGRHVDPVRSRVVFIGVLVALVVVVAIVVHEK